MKKSYKRREKSRTKIIITLSIIVLLAVSTVSIVFLYGNSGGDNNTQPPTDNTANPENSSSPTPAQSSSYQIKILNKQIPSNYVMGFPMDSGLVNGMNVIFLQDQSEKFSVRFTAKSSGTVTKLALYTYAYNGEPTIRVGLQKDSEGNPSGHWLSENAFGSVQLSSGSGFKTIQLQASATIEKGKIYHLVTESAEVPLNGEVAFNTYKINSLAQPFNPEDPDIVWNDPQMNTLFYAGGRWQEQNKWPIFVVGYADGALEGQPYSIDAPWVVYGSTYVGQALIPASDYRVGKIAFDVSLKASEPQDNLHYRIIDSNNNVLSEGVFAEPNQLTDSQKWVEVTLQSPVVLEAGQLYRICLFSPKSTLANAYHVYGHEFCYDPIIGYGSFQHQLTSSIDGGVNWGENKDADAIFKITTIG